MDQKKIAARLVESIVNPWLDVSDVEKVCASCADKMRSKGIAKVRDNIVRDSIREAAAWDKLPDGWDQSSLKKFWDTMTGNVKHKITKCMKEMKGKVSDTGAFCASLSRKMK